MDVKAFLEELRRDRDYADQIVHVHEMPARDAEYAEPSGPGDAAVAGLLGRIGIDRLYAHQADAVRLARDGKNVLVATGTASGKTLCYTLPLLARMREDPNTRALLLFPTKALTQDQFGKFATLLHATGLSDRLAGVYDGDTPSTLRRKLRDKASVLFSNPDMLHASVMAQHARWADFLGKLKLLVLDEMHVYNGIFGSNMALVLKRLFRLCRHYGSSPQIIGCSATIANPRELAERLTGRSFELVDRDASPRGRRTYVFWNPPRVRRGNWRSRRSANVEAHELMARLIGRGIATITFSKAKMTAEMIHRYVTEKLRETAPGKASKVTPYRGGYLPEERREIERRLFNGELLGVSTTAALELGIDVGSLGACILVGYPGTLASFYQQSGRAGRAKEDALVFLVGLDTAVNQYVMSEPDYIFDRLVEQAVIEPENPFVATAHLRCAAFEQPLAEEETDGFGPHAGTALRVLESNLKVKKIQDRWYHSASETPNHEVSLRNYADANVVIQDVDTQAVLGEVNKFDAEPIIHPGAIYMHRGDTYRILELDMERNLARAKRENVDYYTQPLGGTDIHHIDQRLREKSFGAGRACWGEATAYFGTWGYEKIHFYTLDAISVHQVDLPTLVLETMAVWLIPPEDLMERVRSADLDPQHGLRGVGYGTRMLLPLFVTCDTLDFSHTVGSANSPWHTVFIYERYPHGLGFTEKAYEMLDVILPAVLENICNCPCEDGCPCCVGKPLRGYTTWNVERGEASIPSKAAARMILEGTLGDGTNLKQPDNHALTGSDATAEERIEQTLRRRLERMREPQVFHRITPEPELKTEFPAVESQDALATPDVAKRAERRRDFDKDLHKRIAKKIRLDGLAPHAPGQGPPEGMHAPGGVRKPTDFQGKPATGRRVGPSALEPLYHGDSEQGCEESEAESENTQNNNTIALGDSLAARARKRYRRARKKDTET